LEAVDLAAFEIRWGLTGGPAERHPTPITITLK